MVAVQHKIMRQNLTRPQVCPGNTGILFLLVALAEAKSKKTANLGKQFKGGNGRPKLCASNDIQLRMEACFHGYG